MAQHEKEQFTVLEGPSKFDLMTALFVGGSDEQLRVKFTLQPFGETAKKSYFASNKHLVDVRLLSIGREDGSGENWILKGYIRFSDAREIEFSGFYTTRRRSGHFNVTFR